MSHLLTMAVVASTAAATSVLPPPQASTGTVAQQPTLDWTPRSDWLNVKTGCGTASSAKGDGQADDSAAIQACISNMTGGSTLYLPPGTYKISKTLFIGCKNHTVVDPKTGKTEAKITGCMVGGNIKGHGAATRVVWAGALNETMLIDSGITGFRSMGVHWDGGGIAGVGFAHQSIHLFETENVHEVEAYTNFNIAGIGNDLAPLASGVQGATAEVFYRNCLFDGNAVGISWVGFNALDNAIDGCLFRNNIFGINSIHGTAYVTNSRFDNSSACDMQFGGASWNHNTLRNIVSVGSNQFLRGEVTITLFDCHVYGWVGNDQIGAWWHPHLGPTKPDSYGDAHDALPPQQQQQQQQQQQASRGRVADPVSDPDKWGAALAYNGQMQIHDSSFNHPRCPNPCNQSVQGNVGGGGVVCNKTTHEPIPGRDDPRFDPPHAAVTCCILSSEDADEHKNPNPVLIVNSTITQIAGAPAWSVAQWTCHHYFGWNRNGTATETDLYFGKKPAANPDGLKVGPNVTVLGLPDGSCPATGINQDSSFFKSTWDIPSTKLIEVSQFGDFPTNNKTADATDAMQQTIDAAAAAGNGALAYFPPGTYYISKPLHVKGSDFWVSGANDLATMIKWIGLEEVTDEGMIAIAAGSSGVVIEELSISTGNASDSVPKVVVTGGGTAKTNITINRLELGGYSNHGRTGTSGLTIKGLGNNDFVSIIGIDGDVHVLDNGGLIFAQFHTGGQTKVEGASSGFFGERVRFTCCTTDYTTSIVGAQTYACGAFYQESGPNIFHLTSEASTEVSAYAPEASAPSGNVAINAIKLAAYQWNQSLFDGWTGNFLLSGGWAFTQAKQYSNMTILHKAGKLNLSIVLAFPWNHPYSFDMGSDAHLTQVGNMQHDSSGANHRISDTTWSGSAENIVAGYDLLRKLGRIDLEHHYPQTGVTDTCSPKQDDSAASEPIHQQPWGEGSVLGAGSINVRASPPGPPSLLPQFQQLADFAQSETIGFQHFGNKATNVVPNYNASKLCDDPKRPHDVCSPPPLDMNGDSHSTRYLPYLLMNQYRSERVHEKMLTLRLGDERLRVDVTPQFGGKVYAMTDVPSGKAMLHTPDIRTPVQSARLSAQVDGGIEWNYSPGMLGHWPGTQQDVWAAKLSTSKGPMLRVYEFDRWNETFFQVDMLIANGTLFAHPKLFNPNPRNLTGYWWACSGLQFTVPTNTTECSGSEFVNGALCTNCQSSAGNLGTRVLTPSTHEVDDSLELEPWPMQAGKGGQPKNTTLDMSWLSNWIKGDDNFIRISKTRRPHITVVDKDLYGDAVGLAHFHTLNGTKFWSGGAGGNSQRWYNWKDAPASDATGFNPNPNRGQHGNGGAKGDTGCFFEPQVGVGPTQARGFHFAHSSTMEWTHVWRPLRGVSEEALYGADYQAALEAVEHWSESSSGVPKHHVAEMDKFFREEASLLPITKDDVLHVGQPFGALHVKLPTATPAPLSMYFGAVDESVATGLGDRQQKNVAEVKPWVELLDTGTFSKETLSPDYIPLSYQTSALWEAALEKSVSTHGATHMHLLYLGIIAAERLDVPRAMDLLTKSLKLQPTIIAHRCLAALGFDAVESWKHYQSAWSMALTLASKKSAGTGATLQHQLAGEIALFLTTVSNLAHHNLTYNAKPVAAMWSELDDFLDRMVPQALGCKDRGPNCDHDMIAFSRIVHNFQRGTVEGCNAMFKLMKTWPIMTDAGNSYVFSRSPHLQTRFVPQPSWNGYDPDSSYWATCLIKVGTAQAGHSLSNSSKAALWKANQPPYWLGFALS